MWTTKYRISALSTLACAFPRQAARADFIVTGNKRDFPDGPYGPTRVVSAGELLDRITLEM